MNVVYFSADIINFRQRQNNVVIFNVEFHSVDQRRNNVVNIPLWKSWKEQKNILSLKKKGYTEFQV